METIENENSHNFYGQNTKKNLIQNQMEVKPSLKCVITDESCLGDEQGRVKMLMKLGSCWGMLLAANLCTGYYIL